MDCPKCAGKQVFIIDSRAKTDHVWRRRECRDCGYRWNTVEVEQDLFERRKNDLQKRFDQGVGSRGR